MSNHDEREPDAGASPDEYITDGRTGESYVFGQTFQRARWTEPGTPRGHAAETAAAP